jgi:shikimate kinase
MMELSLSGDNLPLENFSGLDPALLSRVRKGLENRVLVLIGMMGAGKSSIGRRLAHVLDLPFVDADIEIEKAAGMPIADIFAEHGEAYFRSGESRVIARLLEGPAAIVATGGGAWMDRETRMRVRETGLSVWLKSPLDVLMRRVRKRGTRPLLNNPDPEGIMRRLMAAREPDYETADLVILSLDTPHYVVLLDVLKALDHYFTFHSPPSSYM